MATKMTVDGIKQMEEELLERKMGLRDELLAGVKASLAELGCLGFEYKLEAVEEQETPKSGHSCSVCGGSGHSKRTCPRKEASNGVVQ